MLDAASVAVLLLLWLTVWLPRLHGPIDLRWDASTYYTLGTSLAEGKGYRLLNEPGEIRAIQYPPVVPLIVAAAQRALGTSDYITVGSRLRLLYFALSGLYLLSAYAVVRHYLDPPHALVVGAMVGLSFFGFLYPSDSLYAELPFGLASMLFLLCHRLGNPRARTVTCGALGAAAYLLRTAGAALLAAWVCESLVGRRFRQAALRAAIASVPVVAWQGYIRISMEQPEYRQPAYSYQRAPYYYSNVSYGENSRLVDPFRPELGRLDGPGLVMRVARNISLIPQSLGQSAWVAPSSASILLRKLEQAGVGGADARRPALAATLSACSILLGVLALGGAVALARRGEGLLPIYLFVSLGMITLTPWQSQFLRYLAPLGPITLLSLISALMVIAAHLDRRALPAWQAAARLLRIGPLALMLLVEVVVASSLLRNLQPVTYYTRDGKQETRRLLTYDGVWHELDPALEWVRRHARSTDVVASSVPHLAFLRTGRKAVLPPMVRDPSAARRLLDEVPVTFVILDALGTPGISERYAAPAVTDPGRGWRLAYTAPTGGARVYERIR